MKKRSLLRISCVFGALISLSFLLTACGKNFYFANRSFPPSGVINRVLVAIQNPSPLQRGALQFEDAFYDIRHSYDNKIPIFSIAGYSGALPVTIQNMPEQRVGAVYAEGDGSFTLVDYEGEKTSGSISGLTGLSSSIFISRDERYVYAANQSSHVLTVVDQVTKVSYPLSLPGVFRLSVNPGNTVVLAFVQNSNTIYSVVLLTNAQSLAAQNNPHYNPGLPGSTAAEDCEPQNLPVFCVFPVNNGGATFDNPTKAVFSSDGTTAYVLSCGPECGGATAGITPIPLTNASLNTTQNGPSGIALLPGATLPVPGGATDALSDGNTLYVAGQQVQKDGLFSGVLSLINTASNTITGQFSISDGTHTKMVLGDNNTLWIGSQNCESGERYKLSQSSAPATPFGCITMFNTSNNSVFVDAYKGDGTGIAPVTGLNKTYTAEGGQIYIYNTTDGSQRDNSNVTVQGTAYDVAYMDASSDNDNTDY
ncbi:hypothetical protein [Acidipila rosea]|uniref:DNA-binding beta-propeller fold protein YncE n=1 Tax=Acidipila rosea TaxID=768535 RepID=A0A4V2PVE9_9BACT|nr:hypothetical protein [Acidipila rosea]MBW4043869.1 hypothetical protein [Acidobacteriota bacterium]TCK74171.1 hypothetical protein C7378_1793 [Acidipila rosea]